mmetsp:Transcript_44279/g.141726  ORF Transcript_44279/g.141726 Transcript_44279/m.141726 type:complete len:206 (-) Transcript_44279:178-795(-)
MLKLLFQLDDVGTEFVLGRQLRGDIFYLFAQLGDCCQQLLLRRHALEAFLHLLDARVQLVICNQSLEPHLELCDRHLELLVARQPLLQARLQLRTGRMPLFLRPRQARVQLVHGLAPLYIGVRLHIRFTLEALLKLLQTHPALLLARLQLTHASLEFFRLQHILDAQIQCSDARLELLTQLRDRLRKLGRGGRRPLRLLISESDS